MNEPTTEAGRPECGVMGLCVKPKGHDGRHETTVDRALEREARATPEPIVTPEPTTEAGRRLLDALSETLDGDVLIDMRAAQVVALIAEAEREARAATPDSPPEPPDPDREPGLAIAAYRKRRTADDPYPMPEVHEVDRILRAVLPSDMVFAIAPTGDPFTRWARAILAGSPPPPDLSEALTAILGECEEVIQYQHGDPIRVIDAIARRARAALASQPPSTPREP